MKFLVLVLLFTTASCSYQRDDKETAEYAKSKLNMDFKQSPLMVDKDKDFIADKDENSKDKGVFNYPRISVKETVGLSIDFNLGDECLSKTCYIQKESRSLNKSNTNEIARSGLSLSGNEKNYQSVSDIKDQNYFPLVETLRNTDLDLYENQPEVEFYFNLEISDVANVKKISNIILELGIISGKDYLLLGKFSPKNSLDNPYYTNNNGKSVIETNSPLGINQRLSLNSFDLEKLRRLILKDNHRFTVRIVDFDYTTINGVKLNYMMDLKENKLNPKTMNYARIVISDLNETRTEYVVPSKLESILKKITNDSYIERASIKSINGIDETFNRKWSARLRKSGVMVDIDTSKDLVAGDKLLIKYEETLFLRKSLREEIKVSSNNSVFKIDNVEPDSILDIKIRGYNNVYLRYPTNLFSTSYEMTVGKVLGGNLSSKEPIQQATINSDILLSSIRVIEETNTTEIYHYFIKGHTQAFLNNNTLRFRIKVPVSSMQGSSLVIEIDDEAIKKEFYKNSPSSLKESRLSPAQIKAQRQAEVIQRIRDTQDARDRF
jgi:hypothetical protein